MVNVATKALSVLAEDVRKRWKYNCAGEIFLDDDTSIRIGHFQGDEALARYVVALHNAALSTAGLVDLDDLGNLSQLKHPFADYSLENAVQLAIDTQGILMKPAPTNLAEVREVIAGMEKRATRPWVTGMAALDVLDAAIDGRDLSQSCRLRAGLAKSQLTL